MLKYKDELDILKNDYRMKRAQIKNIKDSLPFGHKKHLKNSYDNFFSNFEYTPEPFLPMLGHAKILNKFYNGLNDNNKNNFFMKNSRKKNKFFNINADSSDYYTAEPELDDNVNVYNNFPLPPPIFPNMNYDYNYGLDLDNEYTDPFLYDQNLKEEPRIRNTGSQKNKMRYNTKRISKMIKTQESKSDDKSDDKDD